MIEVIENEIVVEVVDGPEIVVEVGDGPILPEWGMIGGEIENQDDLMEELDYLWDGINGKADLNHNHDERYYSKEDVNSLLSEKADSDDVTAALALKADASAVYTKQETDTALASKADASAVYTKQETDTALASKADASAVYTKQETDSALAAKADSSAVYTKQETDTALSSKADSSAVYTKQETDTALAAKADSSAVYTKQETDTALASKADSSAVYTKQETDTALAGKANTADLGALAGKDQAAWGSDISGIPSTFPPAAHNHDERYYTESEMDSALAGKANSADLGALAGKDQAAWGSDISGIPSTFPPAAHNHDERYYTESEVNELLSGKADGIVCEVSGDPAVFGDGGDDVPVKALSVGIEPVQDLHGYDGAWVPGGGKNTWVQITPGTYTNGGITAVVDSNNLITVSGTKNTGSEVKIEMPYQISGTIGEINYYIHLRNTAVFENTKVYFNIVTSSTTKVYLNTINRILINTADRVFQSCGLVFTSSVPSGTEYNFTFQPSLENTDAVTEWTPYSNICPISGWTAAGLTVNGTSVPVSFPSSAGTVYGGILDVVNGVLTVNRKMVIFDGSENWMSSGGGFYLDNISAIADVSRTIKPACNLLRWDEDVRKAMSDIAEGFIAFSTAGNQINLKTSAFSAVGEFKDFISENNLQVCGYLVTPVTYQLTPLEVRTVLGQNSVSADCGAVSLRYGADTKLYIDGKFAELQALVLENG